MNFVAVTTPRASARPTTFADTNNSVLHDFGLRPNGVTKVSVKVDLIQYDMKSGV